MIAGRLSRWGWVWVAWLAAFAVLELVAQLSHHAKPRTLSEHLWRWFPRRWWRVVLVGLLTLMTWHLASGPDLQPIDLNPAKERYTPCEP